MSVEYPQNDFTRMIDRVSGDNRSGVRSSGVVSATPLPTAASADLGREVPLSEDERAELDAAARAAGIRDERLGNAEPEAPTAYTSLSDAIAAGAPVNPPVEHVRSPRLNRPVAPPVVAPRLPDFRKVQGINLISNVVMVDDMEFAISAEDALGFKQYVVEIAHAAIMAKLDEAVGLFTTPATAEVTDGGSSTAEANATVQRNPEGSGTEPTV